MRSTACPDDVVDVVDMMRHLRISPAEAVRILIGVRFRYVDVDWDAVALPLECAAAAAIGASLWA